MKILWAKKKRKKELQLNLKAFSQERSLNRHQLQIKKILKIKNQPNNLMKMNIVTLKDHQCNLILKKRNKFLKNSQVYLEGKRKKVKKKKEIKIKMMKHINKIKIQIALTLPKNLKIKKKNLMNKQNKKESFLQNSKEYFLKRIQMKKIIKKCYKMPVKEN